MSSIWGNVQFIVTAGVNAGNASNLRGATVTASLMGGDYTQSTTTDSEGNWQLENLEIGLYDLTASKKNFNSGTDSTLTNVLVAASTSDAAGLFQLYLYEKDPAEE